MEIHADIFTGPLGFVSTPFDAYVRLSTSNVICCVSEQNLYNVKMLLPTVPDWSNKDMSLRLKVESNE